MTPSSFGNPPFGGTKKKTQVSAKGRMIGIAIAVILVALAFLAFTELSGSNKGKTGGSSAASNSSGSSGSSSGLGSFVSRFTGSKADITVCVVTWGGYAGGEYFNGGFKASKNSRYYKDYGMTVEFLDIDNTGAGRDAWKSDQCQVLWTTADSEVTEVGALHAAGYDSRQFFQADNSRGGDVLIGTYEIKTIQDLRGKKVSFAPNTPSNTLLLNALDAAGMTMADIVPVEVPGATESASAFQAGNVDGAVVWSPDDGSCLAKVKGSHVLMSTKQATGIIADTFFAKEKFIDGHLPQLKALVEGWLIGAAEINSDPAAKDKAADILVAGFGEAATKENKDLALLAINNAHLATYGDNLNFFGMNSAFKGVTGEDLYTKMTRMYTVAGKISGAPPSWREIVDLRVLQAVKDGGKIDATGANAAEGAFTFTPPTASLAAAPELSSKPLTVTFPTGSYKLDENAKYIIDSGFAHTAKTFGSVRIRIEGNTDDTGSAVRNKALSLQRAQSVASYLASEYGLDPNKFYPVGNGSDKPVCNDATDACRAKNRRTDFQLISQ